MLEFLQMLDLGRCGGDGTIEDGQLDFYAVAPLCYAPHKLLIR